MTIQPLERRLLLAAGELDLSFGELGVAAHQTDSSDTVETIALLPGSGKLLTGGFHSPTNYVLTRFNADGTPDTSFGTNGQVLEAFGTFAQTSSAIEQITPLAQGKLLVSGYQIEDFFQLGTGEPRHLFAYFVQRLLADGSADPSFHAVELPSDDSTLQMRVRSPQALPDGRAVVLINGALYGLSSTSGTVDASFGSEGVARLVIGDIDRAMVGLHVMSDGKILVSDGQSLARFNSDGSPDTSFGQNGVAVHELGFFGEDGAMFVADDGSVTVATSRVASDEPGPRTAEARVVRFHADGTLDAAFGNGGLVPVEYHAVVEPRPPVFAPDGSVVLSGREAVHPTVNEERTWMRRVTSDGSIDDDFGLVLQRDFEFAAAAVDAQGGLISAGRRRDDLSNEIVLTRLAEGDALTLSGGVASMQGTSGGDRIEFRFTDSIIAVTRNTWGKAFEPGTVSQFAADGGDGDDIIIAANNLLIPARFDGGNGFDRLGGGPARDTLVGGAQRDWIAGAGGADLLIGNGGNDVIQGGGGGDHVYGGGGDDVLLGNGGNDRLDAGAGRNQLFGGAGDDALFTANGSADTIFADAGHDTADADELLDELHGVEPVP